LIEEESEPAELVGAQRIAAENAVERVRRSTNVTSAVLIAADALRDDVANAPEKNVDDDWLYRWRDYAGEVSAEQMQDLWGRVLAGEMKAPGKFSLRTLEFLRNISQSEATLIARLAPFEQEGFIFRENTILDAADLPFAALLELETLGIINGVSGGLSQHFEFPASTVSRIFATEDMIFFAKSAESKKLSFPILSITSLGRQVLSLQTVQSHRGLLHALLSSIEEQGFSLQMADIVERLPGIGIRHTPAVSFTSAYFRQL
jgi:hypothetical protein